MKVVHIIGGLSVSVAYKWVEPETMLAIAAVCAIGIAIQLTVISHKHFKRY